MPDLTATHGIWHCAEGWREADGICSGVHTDQKEAGDVAPFPYVV